MLYSSIASTLLLVSGMVTARPLAATRTSRNVAGAAYFITNDPSGNNVLINSIDHSGKLSYSHAVATGGKGLHGNNTGAPDGLFTQDSVKVGKHMLFAVNPGSNTVTMFKINRQNPVKIKMVGPPVPSGGEFPVSVAFSEKTNQVCVLNGGRINGVQCYSANATKGLVPVPNTSRSLSLSQTTPATGPAGTASDILFSADGTELFFSVKGTPPTPGFIATFNVSAVDGSLSENPVKSTPASGGALPFSMTLLPHTKALLATDPAIGFSVYDFANGFQATSANFPIQGQGATCWSSLSPKTGNIYLTDIGTSIVTEVSVNSTSLQASVVKQYPLGTRSATIDNAIASVGGNDFLYVLSANASSVDVLSLNAPGEAMHLQRLDIQSAVSSSGSKVAFSGNNLQGMATYIMGN